MTRARRLAGGPAGIDIAVRGFRLQATVHPAGTEIPPRTGSCPTLLAPQYGRMTEYTRDGKFECDDRTLRVGPAGELHWARFPVETCSLVIHVDDGFTATPPFHRLLGTRTFFDSRPFGPLLRAVVQELERADAVAKVVIEGLLLELLGQLARARPHGDVPSWLLRVDDLVYAQFLAPRPVDEIARVVGVDPEELTRAYRKYFGSSIVRRVQTLRLEYAEQELVRGRAGLAEIALRSGFCDQSHFTRAYRRHFGVTPGQRRREVRPDDVTSR